MSGKNRKTGNLVALGSAAVVAVYGAGFMRTAEAAQRFAEQSDERRVVADDVAPGVTVAGTDANAPAAIPGNNAESGAAPTSASNVASPSVNGVPNAPAAKNANAPVEVKKVDATTAKVAEEPVTASRSGSTSVPMPPEVTTVMSASGVAVTAAQPVTPVEAKVEPKPEPKVVAEKVVTPPAVATPVAAPPVVAPPATAPVNPATTAKALAAAEAAGPIPTVSAAATSGSSTAGTKYKTGEYTGYGTSRHGDVEVYLETTDGKITYVKISQCLTQYSCSWIEDLPKQVLARQSTKVDAVSGATQSANAFYYALVAALAKAK